MRNYPTMFFMSNDPNEGDFNTVEGDLWMVPGQGFYRIFLEGIWIRSTAQVIFDQNEVYEEEENVEETTGEAMIYPPNDLPAFMRMRITAMEMALARVQGTGLIPATDELIDGAGKIYSFLTGGIDDQ